MKTLRIYGDSFSVKENVGDPPLDAGWGAMLGNLLDIPVKNNGISGSSTEYSISTFIRDVKEKQIGDEDTIIFVTSSLGRLYFSHQQYESPKTASVYLREPPGPRIDNEWYWKNKVHIEWWMTNNDQLTQAHTFESYVQLLKNFAISKPKCTVVVLHAYPYGYNNDIFNIVPPNNFLRANIFLKDISADEYVREGSDFYSLTEFTKFDPRPNHLTIPNLTILANLLSESIKNLTIDNITYDKFQSNTIEKITSKEQYLKYVADGLIPNRYHILNNLK